MFLFNVGSRGGSPRRILAVTVLACSFGAGASPALATVPPGLANPGQAGHVARCQKLVSQGQTKYLATWSKTYAKCLKAIATCVQVKASDPTCLTKAAGVCDQTITTLSDNGDKDAGTILENLVTDFCGSVTVAGQVSDPGGYLYSLNGDACKDRFNVSSFSNGASALAFCLFRETNCFAERALHDQMPRARDLLVLAGITEGHALGVNSCLTNESGAGALATAKAGAALLKCQLGVGKLGASYVTKARGAFSKCADAVMVCAQTKPTDQCIAGATKTCAKQVVAVGKAQTKLHDATLKACEKVPLPDLWESNGGDVGTLAARCDALGVSSLTTLEDYATCLTASERCQVEDSMHFSAPRIVELFSAAGQSFGSVCPAP